MTSCTSKELANSLSKARGKEYEDQLRFISLIVKSFILRELELCLRKTQNEYFISVDRSGVSSDNYFGMFGYSFVTRNKAFPTPSTLADDHKEKTK
jgi:hypothetical protein